MATTIAYKVAGPTAALSVANTQHAAVAVSSAQNETVNYAAFLNTGSTVLCVSILPLGQSGAAPTAPTLVFPVDGTPTTINTFILPASMQVPQIVAVPMNNGGFAVSAIGSAAGPSIMYVTPITPL